MLQCGILNFGILPVSKRLRDHRSRGPDVIWGYSYAVEEALRHVESRQVLIRYRPMLHRASRAPNPRTVYFCVE